MKMKYVAIAAVAVAIGGPAYASDLTYYPPSSTPPPSTSPLYSPQSITGDISLEFGGFSNSYDSSAFADIFGRANLPLSNGWNFEPEVLVQDAFNDYTEFAGVAHFYKNLPNAAVGFFAGVGAFSGSYTDWMVGIEGQSYVRPNGTLGGELHVAGDNNGANWVTGTLFGDYFFNPDFLLFGNVGAWAGWNGSSSGVFGGLGLDKRLTGTPISVFAQASAFADSFSNGGVSAWVGLTANLDPRGTTERDHLRMVPFFEAGAL